MTWENSNQFVSLINETVFAYIDIAFVLIILLWLTVLVWVLKDSLARSKKIWFHILAILLVTCLTPIFWLPLYLAVRPINYRQDRSTARSMLTSMTSTCEACKTKNPIDYQYCYHCGHQMTKICAHCLDPMPRDHEYCHHCGMEDKETENQKRAS